MYTKDAPVSYSQTSIRIIQKQSFLPYLIRLWNSAKTDARENLNQFITQKYDSRKSNPIVLFTFGKRFTNIIHSKLKHNIVYFITIFTNISDSQYCLCGHNSDP